MSCTGGPKNLTTSLVSTPVHENILFIIGMPQYVVRPFKCSNSLKQDGVWLAFINQLEKHSEHYFNNMIPMRRYSCHEDFVILIELKQLKLYSYCYCYQPLCERKVCTINCLCGIHAEKKDVLVCCLFVSIVFSFSHCTF